MDGVPPKLTSGQMIKKWEDAYAEQMHDAAVGKLFRGIIHNLNGVLQAFAMQAELLGLMFEQADFYFSRISNGAEAEKEEALDSLRQLLSQRAVLAEQFNEKVITCQKIVQRTLSLRGHPAASSDSTPYRLADLIKEEIDFLCADSFFKHKVAKEVELAEHLTVNQSDLFGLRLAIQAVLHNALEALTLETQKPTIRVSARGAEKKITLEIGDNGRGLSEEIQKNMFLPFFSTKANHIGLGLYMAKIVLESLGGEITATSHDGATSFVLQFRPFGNFP